MMNFPQMYIDLLATQWSYLTHLLVWMLPIVILQWVAFPKILWRNKKAIALAPLILGTYLIITDVIAIKLNIWHFSEDLILGINFLGVPVEECIFFFLTALLVTQSFILFLPTQQRH